MKAQGSAAVGGTMQALSPRWAVLALLLVLTSCAALTRDPPVPPPISRAAPFDFRQILFLPFEGAAIRQSIERAVVVEAVDDYSTGAGGGRGDNYLVVFCGGCAGALVGGLINGWTEEG